VVNTSNDFKLPDVGEGLTEAEIVTWYVKVGDTIKVNDIVCDIETAKSVVELPSPYAGVVQALLVDEGETVEVGTPIIRIGDASAPAAEAAPAAQAAEPASTPSAAPSVEPASAASGVDTNAAAAETPSEDEQPMTLVGSGPKEAAVTRRPRSVATGAHAANVQAQSAFEPGPAPEVQVEEEATEAPVLAKPPARLQARELGVDLRAVSPSRPDGVITADDVTAAATGAHTAPAATPAPTYDGARETREPIRGVRKMMGQAMVDSAFTAPHVSIWTTVDVTRTMELVERLKGHREFRDVKVSPLLIVAKAAVLALRRTPLVNSAWDEAAQEIVLKRYVNLGIAAATPRGLVVPHVKEAQDLSLPELASAIAHLTATAREGRTAPADQVGGTFTITNVGPFGMEAGTPIINPGESAILCFGAIERRPWVVGSGEDEQIVPRDVCTLALSFDHRHIDGATGSGFLADVAGVLEDPATALFF